MADKRHAFKITRGRGFHMTFANGITASVQWGYGNYCENRFKGDDVEIDWNTGKPVFNTPDGSDDAEVWAWRNDGPDIMRDVLGWLSADEVLRFLNMCVSYKDGDGDPYDRFYKEDVQ